MSNEKIISIAVHGGAGVITRKEITSDKEKIYKESLEQALKEGWKILEQGGTALDAVTASCIVLENIPLFNAGKGSVFTSGETHEMDAAIMDGRTLKAGCAAGIKNVKNPVLLARKIMENSKHVFLAYEGAEEFAKRMNLEFEDSSYFYTEFRYKKLQEAKEKESKQENADKSLGTIGAVAMDMEGNLASATSSGGMTNKKFGRIGDTPIIGSGTYANNKTCAVSCTGDGEYFIRCVTAFDVSCLMEYGNMALKQAAEKAIKKLGDIRGEGGLIAVDKNGNLELVFNSKGMYRSSLRTGGEILTEIF
jgi:beta-aspartyl-peptidase (threonine type)